MHIPDDPNSLARGTAASDTSVDGSPAPEAPALSAAKRAQIQTVRLDARDFRPSWPLAIASLEQLSGAPTNELHDQAEHALVCADPVRWNALAFVGYQDCFGLRPPGEILELRNCTCGSTLARRMREEDTVRLRTDPGVEGDPSRPNGNV